MILPNLYSAIANIESGWKSRLQKEFEAPYFHNLEEFLVDESNSGKVVYPPIPLIFNALNLTPFKKVKVVLIGQDPYHGPNQANGLCFSVSNGVSIPPSLRNIFKELAADLEIINSENGNLEKWAKQGVLLLNSTLTVRNGEAASHQNKGWEQFTNEAIRCLSDEKEGLIFLLWGKHAGEKAKMVNDKKHILLKAAHPSPLSAWNGFFGCRHFSKVNDLLSNAGSKPIDWKLK